MARGALRFSFQSAFLLAGITTGLASCAQPERSDRVGSDLLLVAVAGPMSGQYSEFGRQMTTGAEAAVADINVAGGIQGRPLRLITLDDRCNADSAVERAREAVREGVVFVAGHFCSGSSIPASDVYAARDILMISPASTNPRLTDRGLATVFRVAGRDDRQGAVAADTIVERQLGQRVAVVRDETEYADVLVGGLVRRLRELGINPVMQSLINRGQRDFSNVIEDLTAGRVDVVYFAGFHPEAAPLRRQMVESDLEAVFIGPDSLVTDEYWNAAGQAARGTLMTFGPDPTDGSDARPVVAALRADGHEVEGYVLYTYAAFQLFDEAAERAGSTDASALGQALSSGQYDTVLGPVAFDEKGDVISPAYVVWEWRGGRYRPLP